MFEEHERKIYHLLTKMREDVGLVASRTHGVVAQRKRIQSCSFDGARVGHALTQLRQMS